jgi:hypothetical protein
MIKDITGKLTFIHPNSKAIRYGTGILISDNLVVTPAHNIYDRQANHFYMNIEFQIGEGKSCKVRDYCFMEEYSSTLS